MADEDVGHAANTEPQPRTPRTHLWVILAVAVLAVIATGFFAFRLGGLSSAQRAAVDAAVSDLGKVNAATEVGVNYQQYGSLLISAQASVNSANRAVKKGPMHDALNRTMEAYADAATIWKFKIDNQSYTLIKPGTMEWGLVTKYGANKIGSRVSDSGEFPDTVLQDIWRDASSSFAEVEKLSGK